MDLADLNSRMHGAVTALKSELAGLRTGRASANLVEPISVEAYGTMMPLNQVATISVPEPRMINIQVWDRSMIQPVERAIRESSLGLNPIVEGQLLRVPIPELNAERRQELVKVAHKYAEQARVAVRHVRRDGLEAEAAGVDARSPAVDVDERPPHERVVRIGTVRQAEKVQVGVAHGANDISRPTPAPR